jgi:hypothetical protein
MASEWPSPACDQLPPRTTRGQWHDSPGVIPNPRCHGKWEVVQQAMFDYQRQIHFKHVQTIGMPTDQTISKMLLDQHSTYQGKMDRKHQETMQNGFCS